MTLLDGSVPSAGTSSAHCAKISPNTGDPSAHQRLLSLDVYRGLVIVVMTFVNYLSPLSGIPAWAKHQPESLEGYTFVDVVFPAFLFIVGAAIPFALKRRMDRGDSTSQLVGKIILRSATLLFLGVLTVNEHSHAAGAGVLSKPLWFSLALLCAVAIWNSGSPTATPERRRLHRAIQIIAGLGLASLLCLFRSKNDAGQTVWLEHSYWGMLGMIGWAYLASSLCWLIFRNNLAALMGVTGFMLALFVGGRHGALDWLGPVQQFVNVGINFGSNPATVMMGVLVGAYLMAPCGAAMAEESSGHRSGRLRLRERLRLRFMVVFGLGLYVTGSLLRPLHGISKSYHTESYALVTGGICCILFAAVYYLVDVRQMRRWSGWLIPLGQNALLAYLLPFIVANLLGTFGLSVYWARSGLAGAGDAAMLTALILFVTWLLSRVGIRLRL